MGSQGTNCGRVCVMGTSMVLLFFGLVLAMVGIFSPAWWYLDVDEYLGGVRMEYTIGLWMICRRGEATSLYRPGGIQLTGIAGYRWVCDTRHSLDPTVTPYIANTEDHYETLAMLCIGTAVGLLSLMVAFCGFCFPYLTFVYGIGCVVAAGLISGGTIMYYIDASRDNVRQYISATGRVFYLRNEYAVWCALVSSGILLFNVLLTVPACLLSIMYKNVQDEKRMERKYRYDHMEEAPPPYYSNSQHTGTMPRRSSMENIVYLTEMAAQHDPLQYNTAYNARSHHASFNDLSRQQPKRQPQIIVMDRPRSRGNNYVY